jgi:archaeosine-15-forming tRNA-guanine transglycosylase
VQTINRTVITVEMTPLTLRQGKTTVHEAHLDGDENLRVGDDILLSDGAGTYRAATVTEHGGDLYELTLTR